MNNNLSAASIPNVITLGKPVNQSIVGSPQPVGGQQTLMPNVQLINMRPATATVPVQKSVATVSPRVVIGAPQVVASRPAAPGITLQGLPGIQAGQQGHLLLKTENGQYQLLRVGPAPPTSTLTAQAPQTLRLSTVPAATTNIAPAPTLVQQVALPGGVASPIVGSVVPAVPAVAAPMVAPVCNLVPNARQTAAPPIAHTPLAHTPLAHTPLAHTPLAPVLLTPAQQKIADNTKEKCRNFLANLLDLSSKEPKSVEISVKTLIQELIDARVEPEEFCDRLERLLNASPQPCLIGFLKKSLPLLRQSLVVKELIIEGINAPPVHVAYPFCSDQITSIIDPRNNVAPSVQNAAKPNSISVLQNVAIQPPKPVALGKVPSSSPGKTSKGVAIVLTGNASRGMLNRDKEKKIQSYTATFTDIDKMAGDDDINDVAAMGGVNLAEESQKILGSTEMIGIQIRSCKDEYLVQPSVMQAYTKKITTHHGLEEITPELCNVLSHGLQEVLKNIMENLVNTALDRLETDKMKENDVFENVTDLKGQLSFLEEIDYIQTNRARKQRMQTYMDIEMKDEQGTNETDKEDEERPSKRPKLDNQELPVKSINVESLKSLDDSNPGTLDASYNDFLRTEKLETSIMETSDIDTPDESETTHDLDKSNDFITSKVSESLIDMEIQDAAVSSTSSEPSRNPEASTSINTREEDIPNDDFQVYDSAETDMQANVVTLRDAQFLLDNDRTYYHLLYKAYISKGLKRYYI